MNKEIKLGKKLEGFAEFFGKYLILDAILSWIMQKIVAILTLYVLWRFFIKPMFQAAAGHPVTLD